MVRCETGRTRKKNDTTCGKQRHTSETKTIYTNTSDKNDYDEQAQAHKTKWIWFIPHERRDDKSKHSQTAATAMTKCWSDHVAEQEHEVRARRNRGKLQKFKRTQNDTEWFVGPATHRGEEDHLGKRNRDNNDYDKQNTGSDYRWKRQNGKIRIAKMEQSKRK